MYVFTQCMYVCMHVCIHVCIPVCTVRQNLHDVVFVRSVLVRFPSERIWSVYTKPFLEHSNTHDTWHASVSLEITCNNHLTWAKFPGCNSFLLFTCMKTDHCTWIQPKPVTSIHLSYRIQKLLDTLCICIEFHWIHVSKQRIWYQTFPLFSMKTALSKCRLNPGF